MSYNQHQQGFSHNPGGVPQGNTPTFPNVPVGPAMQPYLAIMSAKIYNDMISRGTQYTSYMADLYSQNGYNNELFVEILTIVSEYAEYSMAAYNKDFNSVIDSVVQDSNNLFLENHYRRNPSKIPVPVTQQENIRYQAAKTKMATLRQKISQFISQRTNQMNQPYPQQQGYQQQNNGNYAAPVQQPQYNQPPQQQWQQPQQQWGQTQMSPQQQQWQQQQMQQQQPQQQWGQPQNQPYNAGRPQQGNDFAARVAQRMQQGYQPQQPQYHQQQAWNPQPNMQRQPQFMVDQYGNQVQVMPQQQMYQQQPQYPQQGHHGQFAVSSNQAQQHHYTPPRSTSLSNSGYDPMPQVDESKLKASNTKQHSDPFAHNSQIMADRKQFSPNPVSPQQDQAPNGNSNPFTQGASYSEPAKPIPSNTAIQEYENKVRRKADSLGLPHKGASLSYLEELIGVLDPKNGFIDSKNAYSEQKSFTKHGTPDGHYGKVEDVFADANISVYTDKSDMTSDSFATQMRNQMASKSDKQMLKQADGSWQLVSNDLINAFQQEFPNIDINTVDIQRYKDNPPYEFAVMNLKGEWIVPASYHGNIKTKGWFTKPAMYPVHTYLGFYIVDQEGVIIDFFSRPKTTKESEVDFELHDDSKFFTPLSPQDLKVVPDEAKLLETFANLQIQQKVSEVLSDIEKQAGVIDGEDAALIINKTIVIEDQVNGELLGDDYYTRAYNALHREMGDVVFETADVSFRYKHVHMYPWLAKGSDMTAVRKLRYKDNYLDIAKVLADISETEGMTQSWFTRLNDVATRYVNHVIETQFPLNDNDFFFIKSFCLEVKDAVEEMDRLGYGNEFNKTAKRLTDSLLYAWDNTNPVFVDYFDDELMEIDDGVSSEVSIAGFGIVRDVSVIPLHSRDVPLHAEKEKCLLTEHGFNNLWKVAKERIDNRDARTSEIVIVTSDNRHMYLSETAVDGVYAITKKSLFE